MKKVIGKIFIFLVLFGFSIPCVHASTEKQTLGDLKQQLAELKRQKEENDNKTAEAKAEIAAKEAAIAKAKEDIHAAEEQQITVEEEIEKSNEKIKELEKEAESVLLYMQQMEGQNAYVEYVSGAGTITDMIMRIAVVEQISGHIQTTITDLEAEIKKNEELKKELIEKQENLKKQTVEYQKAIEALYGDISKYDEFAKDLPTQIKDAESKLKTFEPLCKEYASEKGDNAILTEDCVKPAVGNGGYVIQNGAWLKPLTHGTITSTIGSRWGSYHNALDIGGPSPFEGTPVYAAAAGVVSGRTERYSCGGNMLFIDVNVNGQPYTTYYYHLLKFNVNIGDVVDQNTVIGWVGGYSTSSSHGGYDTCTTGAHLHFGVQTGYYNGYSITRSKVITPPGFPNTKGWSFSSRYQMY